jgi:hypothetical protein
MNLDDYLKQSAPAGDQRGDEASVAIPDLLSCLSRAAVDTTASYIQAGPDMKERVAIRLGDTLWYVAAVARRLDLSLSALARKTLNGTHVPSFDAYTSLISSDNRNKTDLPAILLNGLSRAAIDSTSGYVQAEMDKEKVANGLGETLRHIAAVAHRLDLSLSAIAFNNIEKTTKLFGSSTSAPKFFDDNLNADEQLPRLISLRISEFERNELLTVRLAVETKENIWLPIGNPLNDNAYYNDDYRFHDVLHLAYMATLGWSPVMRALFGVKRKSKASIDRVEDGARAALLEEALTGFIYEAATDNRFFENTTHLERHLLLTVKRLTRGLEVGVRTYEQWNLSILAGYRAFRALKIAHMQLRSKAKASAGVVLGSVHVDMNAGTIEFQPSNPESTQGKR